MLRMNVLPAYNDQGMGLLVSNRLRMKYGTNRIALGCCDALETARSDPALCGRWIKSRENTAGTQNHACT